MKQFFTTTFFILFVLCSNAQQLGQVTFSGGSSLTSFALIGTDGVILRISVEGKILEWGYEIQSERNSNYYAPNLQPYLGRVDYYGPESDSVFRGKIKSIGSLFITYYNQYETVEKIGKLKTVSNIFLDYYSNYDDATFKGKLKFIGSSLIGYYSSFEDEGFRGKLKTIGNSTINYFSIYDDKYIRGKIKSIGGINYQWYTSLDRLGYGGGLKSGIYRQNINGVTYILQ
jgi:hypothetical protein